MNTINFIIFMFIFSSLAFGQADLNSPLCTVNDAGDKTCPDIKNPSITYNVPSQQTLDQRAAAEADREKTTAYMVSTFDINIFVEQLGASNLANDLNVLPYYAVIKDMALYKNFSGLKNMVNALLSAGKLNQDEVNILNSILANQNINLNNF